MANETRSDSQFFGVMVYGLALGFGGVCASLASIRSTPAGFTIDLSLRTALAFVLGTVLMVPCFRIILFSESKKRKLVAWSIVGATGLAGFLYPIRFVPTEKMRDIVVGLISAVFALSGIAALMILTHRFLEADRKSSDDKNP